MSSTAAHPAFRLLLIGCGKMGSAMLQGWLTAGVSPQEIAVVEPHVSDSLNTFMAKGVALLDPGHPAPRADVVLLAVKPQSLDSVAPFLAEAARAETLLLSILAGKTIANLKERAPAVRAVVRAMPNTPAAVGRGITGCVASSETSEAQRTLATTLLSAIGKVVWVEREDQMDAVTAVSGSGPAYVFHMVEAMAAAGIAAGLPENTAMDLARTTVEGAGELLYRDAATAAATLRQNVTSPGGTTAAALDVLMADDGLTPLMTRAIAAAKRRGEELSG